MTTSTSKNPNFTYPTTGTYTVSLTVTLPSTKFATVTKTIDVFLLGDTSYTYSAVCNTVTFTDTSVAPNIVSWHWDFGDGTSSDLQNPVHDFPMAFNYAVHLTVRTSHGGIGFTSQNIVISSGTVTAAFTSVKTDMSLAFTDTSSVDCGAVAWNWDFGDGTTDTVQNPTHVYSVAGTYTVGLTVYDALGGFSSITHTVSPTVAAVNWCWVDDLTASSGGWTVNNGSYVSSTGFRNPTNDYLEVQKTFTANEIDSVIIHYTMNSFSGTMAQLGTFTTKLSGSIVESITRNPVGFGGGSQTFTQTFSATPSADLFILRLFKSGGTSTNYVFTLTSIEIHGHGANPFGTDNC